MKLADYLAGSFAGTPIRGSKGIPSEWLDWTELDLKGSQFLVVDANFAPSAKDGLPINLVPGKYSLTAQVMTFGRDNRISRLRCALSGAAAQIGPILGTTWTDTALTGICDYKTFSQAWCADGNKSYEKIRPALQTLENFGIAVLDAATDAILPFVSSGFGDGIFNVYEVLTEGRRVGFEIEFIPADRPYPFGARVPVNVQSLSDEVKTSLGLNISEADAKAGAELALNEFLAHLVQVRKKAPPTTIRLTPAKDQWCLTVDAVRQKIEFLENAGFAQVGVFVINGTAHYVGFAAPALDAFAAVVFTRKSASHLSFSTVYQDGTIFEVSDFPRTAGRPQADWQKQIRLEKGTEASAVLAAFLKNRPEKPAIPATSEGYVATVEQEYATYQSWLSERGGSTRKEIFERLKKSGQLPEGRQGEEILTNAWSHDVQRALCNWWSLQASTPCPLETVWDKLAIIYNGMSATEMATTYWCLTRDFQVKESDFTGSSARLAFAIVNANRGGKFKLVLQKHTNLQADFYLPV